MLVEVKIRGWMVYATLDGGYAPMELKIADKKGRLRSGRWLLDRMSAAEQKKLVECARQEAYMLGR